jgi:hypothetical protein
MFIFENFQTWKFSNYEKFKFEKSLNLKLFTFEKCLNSKIVKIGFFSDLEFVQIWKKSYSEFFFKFKFCSFYIFVQIRILFKIWIFEMFKFEN